MGGGVLDTVMLVTAWVLLALGLAVVLWALFFDRSRGRKRCPRCWYDMGGATGLTCPECGRTAAGARHLLRTRRRWRRAALGFALLAGAYAAWVTPGVRHGGWIYAVPRPVFLAWIPPLDREPEWNNPGLPELYWWRLRDTLMEFPESISSGDGPTWRSDRLWWFERAILRRACLHALRRGDAGLLVEHAAKLVLALDPGTPIEGLSNGGAAWVVLKRTEASYAGLVSYYDRAERPGSYGHKHDYVSTAYDAATRAFRFEKRFRFPPDNSPWEASVVWRGADEPVRSWSHVSPTVEEGKKLWLALAGHPGEMVPGLLAPDAAIMGRGFLGVESPSLSFEPLDGVECFVISHGSGSADPATSALGGRRERLWIDAARHLVLASQDKYGKMTRYHPVINEPLGPEWFTFDPERPSETPLGRWIAERERP